MRWDEFNNWMVGEETASFYEETLQDAGQRPARDKQRKRILKPAEMPWELSRHGLIKHLVHKNMNVLVETIDVYMQIIPPGSRSGKHRHLAEECIYVVEGKGYDMHCDCDVEIDDTYHWIPQKEVKRFDWQAGDVVYIPPNTIHQHYNADPVKPCRIISGINRLYEFAGLNDLEQIDNAPEYTPQLSPQDLLKRILSPAT